MLTQQVTSLLGVDDQVESLKRELRWMQSFLKVAGSRKADNEVMRKRVADIRDLAYDAEDVIETFALKVASRRKVGFSNCIKRSACCLKECCLLCQTKSEIEKITTLLPLFIDQESECSVVAICGMGGLVIFDDIWNIEAWNSLKPAFPIERNSNSKILLTSRRKEIVSHADPRCYRCALRDTSDVKDVLALSYDDLPPYLTPCIVSPNQEEDCGEIVEDVAEGYLMELVERCMIQVCERDIATLEVKTFQMHDLMRDFCMSKAKEEKFFYIVDQSNACSPSTDQGFRRISMHEYCRVQCIKSTKLRSLLFFKEIPIEALRPRSLVSYEEGQSRTSLQSSSFDSVYFNNCNEIDTRHLTHLLSCCGNLHKLRLAVEISKLTEYHYLSSNLVYIKLIRCKLEEDPMPTLEKLPDLRVLEFHDKAFEEKEMFCPTHGFPKLESLSLMYLENLEELKVDEKAMPSLRELEIGYCPNLNILPNGLRFISALEKLKIESMPKTFIAKVLQGREHVPFIFVRD
ncbi:putative disease resistance protein [Gossypium australe]|uniref:Putative disease resistance protein n=1 Tax=Gossypium australe TaxID=47621 RepID=A0A5B6VTE2_9ROSI|nr:putative disease resistance protein [Gossypium australe]